MHSYPPFRRLALGVAFACAAASAPPAPLEAQSAAFVHIVTAANRPEPAQTVIDHPLLNNRPGAIFFVRHLRNPPGAASIAHPHAIDVWYTGIRWVIENPDSATHALGTAFAVWVPEVTDALPEYFVHETTADNVVLNLTVLDHPLLNGNPGVTLTVTLNAPTVGFNHHLGVWYDSDSQRWTVFNQDQATMPAGLRYFVGINFCSMFVGQSGQTYHLTLVTNPGNTEGHNTFIGLAQNRWNLLVTPAYIGTYLDKPIGTHWIPEEAQQAIFVETFEDMPMGVEFHRIGTTGIFVSRFETGTLLGWTVGP
jgi:hypothetical protein